MQKEIWKPVKNYEGLYEVSNFGRVKALNHRRSKKEKLMSPSGSGRYLHVGLHRGGKREHYSIHKLVLQAFLGNSDLTVNHINGIKTDNSLKNLEYCSQRENVTHAIKTGLRDGRGEKNNKAKLTFDAIKNIRENKFNLTVREFAACYNVFVSTIYKIINRETWRHVS